MAGPIFPRATELAVMAAARRPDWTAQHLTDQDVDMATPAAALAAAGDYTNTPQGSDGVSLDDRVMVQLGVDLRAESYRRKLAISIATVDPTAVYTVTIAGNAHAYDASTGGGTVADILDGIKGAINAGVDATASVPGGGADIVVVQTIAENPTLTGTATGTGIMACVAEPDTASLRYWVRPYDSARWRCPPNAAWNITQRGFAEVLRAAGLTRGYIEVHSISGSTDTATASFLISYLVDQVTLGPCAQEVPTE